MGQYTTFLYARPSFTEGLARVLDVGGTLNVYNVSPTGECADYQAIKSDWLATGKDIWDAIEKLRREYQEIINRGKKEPGKDRARKDSCQTTY